jgi:hypothetical protein
MESETINIIKANARLLFGRHQTYDVVTSQGPSPSPHTPLPVARAYLIAYKDFYDKDIGTLLPAYKGTMLKVVGTGLGSYHRVKEAVEVLGRWMGEGLLLRRLDGEVLHVLL